MAHFKEYGKVHRWDHEDEVSGINIGTVYIQEKIDGANSQVTQGDDGYLYISSRNRNIARAKNEDGWPFEITDGFRGLPEFIFKNKKIREFFADNGDQHILYGEWLVKHAVNYAPEFQRRFWIFDVYDKKEHKFLPFWDYYKWIDDNWGLDMIGLVDELVNPSMEDLLSMVRDEKLIPPSEFGAEIIEGLVYKNYDFINKFGDCTYMKAVTKDFHEVPRVVMGANRHDPPEIYLIAKYQTVPRMDKIYNKLVDKHGHLEMRNIPEFMESVLHDLFVEEGWNMFMRDKKANKTHQFDMRELRRISYAKSKSWFIDRIATARTAVKEDDDEKLK